MCDIFIIEHKANARFNALFFRRHGVQSIPTTWIGLEKWLQEVWRDKDNMLDNVYDKKLKFPAHNSRQHLPVPLLPIQLVSLAAFVAFIVDALLHLASPLAYWWLWVWVIVTGAFMAAVSKYTRGIQHFEAVLETHGVLGTVKKLIFGSKQDCEEDDLVKKNE